MKKLLTITMILILFLSACGKGNNDSTSQSNEKIKIVTTNSIRYDIVKNVGGNKVEIHIIVSIGQYSHEYEVKPKDINALTNADFVFYNGLNLETGNVWFENALSQANKSYEDGS